MQNRTSKKFQFPHIYVLLSIFILICTAATWILPAGEFDRVQNASGRTVVVAGTYHRIEQSPVGPFKMVESVYDGMLDAGEVIFL